MVARVDFEEPSKSDDRLMAFTVQAGERGKYGVVELVRSLGDTRSSARGGLQTKGP